MEANDLYIGSVPITYNKFSHYCMESSGKTKRWLRDDFQIKYVQQKEISVFSKIDHGDLPGLPFGGPAQIRRKDYKKYTLLIHDKLYAMEEIILSSEQLMESEIIHYIISNHDLRVHSVGAKQEEILSKLSDREIQVLVMLAKGQSMRNIANQLFLSPHTIDSHRLNLCKKLQVRRTTELAVWAYKLGLLEHEPLQMSC